MIKRESENIIELKNGNLIIKYSPDSIKESKRDQLLFLSDVLSWLDCYFIGETYCLNNYEMGHTIYNLYSDLVYIFPWSDLEELEKGKCITLFAATPDETDREIIESEGM